MRLIDADKAIINFGFEFDDIPPTIEEFVSFLKRQKPVDAKPIVHAHWIEDDDVGVRGHCSYCGWNDVLGENYCPHCGAKMDEVTE